MINPYAPEPAIIDRILALTSDTYSVSLKLEKNFDYAPGQFVEVSILGVGEAPISITSTPTRKPLELCVRGVGNVTNTLIGMSEGAEIGVRGPYGNGFPVNEMKGSNLLVIAGGIGIAPLRSLLNYALDKRRDYRDITLFYGTRNHGEILYKKDLDGWSKRKDMDALVTLDEGDSNWKGFTGVITTLFNKKKTSGENAYAVVCGPPIMYRFVLKELLNRGFPEERILFSLERRMKCGIGKCGHCMIGSKYVCEDGPVFSYKELKNIPGAL
jgi:sulfhydrogenase subunit gamma (sulfur reductase)